jgi:hypothetical protein
MTPSKPQRNWEKDEKGDNRRDRIDSRSPVFTRILDISTGFGSKDIGRSRRTGALK